MPHIEFISDELLETFFGFFEWVYDVEFTDDQTDSIYLILRNGWTDADDSDRSLLAAVLKAQDKLTSASPSDHEALRKRAQKTLGEEFGKRASNDKGHVLDALYDAIEELNPGVIGVKRSRRLGKPDPTKPITRTAGSTERRARRVPPPTERRSPSRSREVIARAAARQEPEVAPAPAPIVAPAGPPKVPLPAMPNVGYLPAAKQAMYMAEYFGKLAQAHMANGDLYEAKNATNSQEQYSAMAKNISDAEQRMIMNIWR